MPDDNQSNGIGEPTPVSSGEGWSVLARCFSYAVVIGGGAVAFALMTTPTRVRGATVSARVKWQQMPCPGVATGAVAEYHSGISTNAGNTPATSDGPETK